MYQYISNDSPKSDNSAIQATERQNWAEVVSCSLPGLKADIIAQVDIRGQLLLPNDSVPYTKR